MARKGTKMKIYKKSELKNFKTVTEFRFEEDGFYPEEEGFEEVKYANEIMYSDVEPWEIIEVVSERKIIIRDMQCEQTETIPCQVGGFAGHFENYAQKWEIVSNPNGRTRTITRRKNGQWKLMGNNYIKYSLDTSPCKFYDYNF